MASSDPIGHQSKTSWTQLYLHGLGASVWGNAQAFGFSVLITVSYGIVSSARGSPGPWQSAGFALSAVVAFSVLNMLVAWLKNVEIDEREGKLVLLVATATDFMAVGAGVGVALAATAWIPGWLPWIVVPFLVGVTYCIVQALEIAVTRYSWS